MDDRLLCALAASRPEIRERWEALLRIERVNTPLANPDTLIYLFDWTLEEVFAALRDFKTEAADMGRACAKCECGRSPYVAYFAAGRQALMEALVLAQVGASGLEPTERDGSVAELRVVMDRLRQREVTSFCNICQHREAGAGGSGMDDAATGVPVRPGVRPA